MKIWRNMRCKYGETQWNSTPVFCIITARWNYISHIAFTNLVMNNRNISPIFWSSTVRFLHCWLGSTVLLIILILITYQSQTNNVIVLFKYSTILFRLERCFGYAVKAKKKIINCALPVGSSNGYSRVKGRSSFKLNLRLNSKYTSHKSFKPMALVIWYSVMLFLATVIGYKKITMLWFKTWAQLVIGLTGKWAVQSRRICCEDNQCYVQVIKVTLWSPAETETTVGDILVLHACRHNGTYSTICTHYLLFVCPPWKQVYCQMRPIKHR